MKMSQSSLDRKLLSVHALDALGSLDLNNVCGPLSSIFEALLGGGTLSNDSLDDAGEWRKGKVKRKVRLVSFDQEHGLPPSGRFLVNDSLDGNNNKNNYGRRQPLKLLKRVEMWWDSCTAIQAPRRVGTIWEEGGGRFEEIRP
jgi:hypothetical protein